MKHFETNHLMLDRKEILKASVEYCADLLKNKEPKEEYKRDILIKHLIHEIRMKDDTKDNKCFTIKEFEELLEELNIKKKEKYKFTLKSGDSYRQALFCLFKKYGEL